MTVRADTTEQASARAVRYGSRIAVAALVLLAVDQATKTAAQVLLDGHRFEIIDGWGVTYVVNPGTWLWPDATGWSLAVIHGAAGAVWLAHLAGAAWYRRHYRPSQAVDGAAAWFTLAVFGNLVDRVLVGGARDWAVTPIAIGNLADVAIWPALALIAWELWRYPPARRLLSWRPRDWRPDASRHAPRGDTTEPPKRPARSSS